MLLAYDALRLKNTIQVIGLCIYNVGLLVEAAVQIDQIFDAVNGLAAAPGGPEIDPNYWGRIHPFVVAVPCVIALFSVLMVGVSWMLYKEFSWSIYTQLSADLNLKRRYLTYQVSIMIRVH